MKNKRVELFVTGILILSFLLAACGQSSGESAASVDAAPSAEATTAGEGAAGQDSATPGEAVEINIAWWGGEARHEKFNTLLDMYQEQNPHITFLRQYAPWGDYWTKLTTQSASNSLPDTFGMTAQYKGDFSARNTMEPLDAYIDSGKIDVSNFTEGSLNAGKIEGQQLFITFGDTVSVLAFNKTLIESAGMELPKGEMTYSEYISYCTELAGKLPEGVFGTIYSWEHQFENHVRQFGVEIVGDSGKEPGYSKEILTSYYEYMKTLFDNKAGPTAEAAAENIGKQWVDSLEGTGRIALFQTNLNQLKIYQAQTENELGAVRGLIADGATHKYVEQVQPSGWAIFPGSQVKDQVAEFISFFVNDDEMQKIFNMELGVPGSSVIQESIVNSLGDTLVDNSVSIEVALIQEILANVEPHPGRKEGAVALWNDVDSKWQEIMFGRMTIEQAVDAHFDNAATLIG